MENLKQNLMKAIKSNYTTKDADSIRDFNNFSKELSEYKEENKEATGAGAAGGFVPPLSGEMSEGEYCDSCDRLKSKCICGKSKKTETKEGTGSGSSGSYEGTSFLAKSQSKKDWRGAAKPLYKGGKFVKVKKKCQKYPYCNQGDIKSLKLTELDIFESLLEKLSKEYQIDKNILSKIIKEDILKNSIN
jgi:hypothetical protein